LKPGSRWSVRIDAHDPEDDHMNQPTACALAPDKLRQRMGLIRALAADALLSQSPVPGGLRSRFRSDPGTQRRVRELVALEQRCCGFLRFEIAVEPDALVLEMTGPPEAQPVIERFFDSAELQSPAVR